MSPIAYAHTFIFVENTIRVFVFALNFNIYTFFSRPTDEHYTCVYASGYLTVLEIRKFLSYSSIDRTLIITATQLQQAPHSHLSKQKCILSLTCSRSHSPLLLPISHSLVNPNMIDVEMRAHFKISICFVLLLNFDTHLSPKPGNRANARSIYSLMHTHEHTPKRILS